MPLSKFYSKTAEALLNRIFKSSGADIRLHGEENIPGQSVLYVINHFTRIETTFLPYLIHKKTGRYALSLAHESFFGGTFGKILEKLGGVSTNDSNRDNILISALLQNKLSVIIFPEGQMLKDKKIIEKGKYMVYNTGMRRPPHTGAARVALITEFYKEKLKYLLLNDNNDLIDTVKKHFGMSGEDIEDLINKKTYIVPVNVTYFPIRAKHNAINRLLDRFVKIVPDRLAEEIEVEGTMLLNGVDIDINFGKPIDVNEYLFKSDNIRKKINNNNLYLDREERKKQIPLIRESLDLMYRYMDSIYEMTTLNPDHIFSYILTMSPVNRIKEIEFKNKVFLAIEEIKKIDLFYCNTRMRKNQFHLLTDDEFGIYNNFINAAEDSNLITRENGYIVKNGKRFNKQFKFHTIRKDNFVEVIKNEIEPLKKVNSVLRKIMLTPPIFDSRNIRNMFISLDNDMFEQDYVKFSIKGESKPKNIGRPFFLKRMFSNEGIILVHGYLAAPEEIRVIADNLYKKGYTVYGVRLRGHGTSPEDLAGRKWIDWYHSVNRAYIIMENSVENFAIIGFSTGAGLALLQASNKGKKFKGLISINAPLKLQNITSNLSSAVVAWNNIMKKMHIKKGKLDFIPNNPENKQINYVRNPIAGVNELEKLMKTVEGKLADISIPALVIQGSDDPVVNPVSGLQVFEKLGTVDKEYTTIFAKRHGIVRGDESEKVTERILDFLDYIFKKK